MTDDSNVTVATAAEALAAEVDADVFLYNSPISRPFDDEVISACCTRKRRKNAILILVTEGGDPDAAYRIARSFQEHYQRFICIVPGYCKSAGTLILTGSHELAMTEFGELGPLDVQMLKKDELGDRESGLLVISALDTLRRSSFLSFEYFFTTMQRKSRYIITFKTAAEYAAKLTTGLFAPIYSQIDPRLIAESSRVQAIGLQYGTRLSQVGQNIEGTNLERLISSYPAHSFVIDRSEAEKLFKSVRKPSAAERLLLDKLGKLSTDPLGQTEAVRQFLNTETEDDSTSPNPGTDEPGRGNGAPSGTTGEGVEREGSDGTTATAT